MISRHAANFVARPVRHLPNGRRRNADRALAASVALAASLWSPLCLAQDVRLPAPPPDALYALRSGGGPSQPTCSGGDCARDQGRFPESIYRRYLGNAVRERIEADPAFAEAPFSAVIAVVVTPAGAVDDVRVLESSGDPERDVHLVATIDGLKGLETPPSSMIFPQAVAVRGKGAPQSAPDNIQSRDPRNAGALKETKGVN